jgi:hypothetical protein
VTDVPLADRPTARYRFYSDSGRALYFGVAVNPENRWEAHKGLSRWYSQVDHSRTKVDWYPNRADAMEAEAEAIRAEDPAFNKTHAVRGISVTDFKRDIRELLHRAYWLNESFAVTVHGAKRGVLVSPEWFEKAMQLMREAEEAADAA